MNRFTCFLILALVIAVPGVPAQEEAPAPAVQSESARAREANDAGVKAYEKKRYAEAIRSFESALAIGTKAKAAEKVLATYRENLFVAHLGLVKAEVDTRSWEKGLTRLSALDKIKAKDARIALWRGILWYRRGFAAAAADHLLTALRRDPKLATAQFFLGRIHYDREELESAIEAWEIAQELDPELKSSLKSWITKARRELAVEASMQTQRSTHFVCKFADQQGRQVANEILDILEDIYLQVGQRYQVYPDRTLTVILYADREFRAATGTHAWVAGLFDGKVRLPVKNFARRRAVIRDTLAHEYTHFAVRTLTSACPAWLNEGLAQLAESGDPRRDDRDLAIRAQRNKLIDFQKLDRSFVKLENQSLVPLAYSQSRSFCAWLLRTSSIRDAEALLRRLKKPADFPEAFRSSYRRSLAEAVTEWKLSLPTR